MIKQISILLSAAIVSSVCYADDYSCKFYTKLSKTDDGYKVESASTYYIDEGNVLQASVDMSNRKIIDLFVPVSDNSSIGAMTYDKGQANTSCSVAYSNKGKLATCDGDFVIADKAGAAVMNTMLTIVTVGIMTATTGGFYNIKPNEENIKLAMDNSDITTSPLIKSILSDCDKQYKVYLAAQQKRKQTEEYTKKAEDRDKDYCTNLLYNINSVSITGKQILDATAKARSYSCSVLSFAEMCNKYMLDETLTSIGKKNCTVGVHNACNQMKSRYGGYSGDCDKM